MNTKCFEGLLALAALFAFGAADAAELPRTPAPKDAELYIITPANGETVKSPVTVRFGLRGMGIAPAGIAMDNTGHHHLLVDADPPPSNLPIPADAKIGRA